MFRTRLILDRTQYKFSQPRHQKLGRANETDIQSVISLGETFPSTRSLGWAVKEQHESLLSIALAVRPSLQHVCDLPLLSESLTALHVASKLGYENITRILLGFCEVDVRDDEG